MIWLGQLKLEHSINPRWLASETICWTVDRSRPVIQHILPKPWGTASCQLHPHANIVSPLPRKHKRQFAHQLFCQKWAFLQNFKATISLETAILLLANCDRYLSRRLRSYR